MKSKYRSRISDENLVQIEMYYKHCYPQNRCQVHFNVSSFWILGTEESILIGQKTKLSRLKKKTSSNLMQNKFPSHDKTHSRQGNETKDNSTKMSSQPPVVEWGWGAENKKETRKPLPRLGPGPGPHWVRKDPVL